MTIFHLVLIRPSHYDSEGYVIQWLRSGIPSNTLAALNGLAKDCGERKILGDDVEIRVTPIDEANTKVEVEGLPRMIERDGGHGLIGLAGVQTNQYPRALDIGRRKSWRCSPRRTPRGLQFKFTRKSNAHVCEAPIDFQSSFGGRQRLLKTIADCRWLWGEDRPWPDSDLSRRKCASATFAALQ